MHQDIVDRLRIDPGKRTLGELLQDREAALYEILRLRTDIGSVGGVQIPNTVQMDKADRLDPESTPDSRMLLKLNEVCELLSVSRSTVYKLLSEGNFPRPVRLGARAIRWKVEDINDWRRSLDY
jgi:prophage regulatory protein